jgi:hypothetical protein
MREKQVIVCTAFTSSSVELFWLHECSSAGEEKRNDRLGCSALLIASIESQLRMTSSMVSLLSLSKNK